MPGGSPWSWQQGLMAGLRHRLDRAAALLDERGVVVEAGPRLHMLFEGNAGSPVGQRLAALCSPEDRATVDEACRRACGQGELVSGLSVRLGSDAERARPIGISLQPLGRDRTLLSLDSSDRGLVAWAGLAVQPGGEERRRHLLQEHLAHRLHGPLAEVLGLAILAVGQGAAGGEADPGQVELLGRQIRHVMAISDDLAALAGEAVAAPTDRVAWLQVGHQLQRLVHDYLPPLGGRAHQRIQVEAPPSAWVRSHPERLRMLLSLLVEVVLSTGLDATLRCSEQGGVIEVQVAARPRPAAEGGDAGVARVADLTVVPLARGVAAAMGADLRLGLDPEGRPLARCRLARPDGRPAPRVELWTTDPDLAHLHQALLGSVGVRAAVRETPPSVADPRDPPDLVLVDVDSVDVDGQAAEHAMRAWPGSACVALSSVERPPTGAWAAVVRKPMGARRVVELLGLVFRS
ncbi:hypothetical protein L6R53_15675 [Myxococcota bacterium]|nr:hypothetical protein [Myxococcota bacterium]